MDNLLVITEQEGEGRRKTRLKMNLSNLMEFEKEDFKKC